jgi:hypothetical protein
MWGFFSSVVDLDVTGVMHGLKSSAMVDGDA